MSYLGTVMEANAKIKKLEAELAEVRGENCVLESIETRIGHFALIRVDGVESWRFRNQYDVVHELNARRDAFSTIQEFVDAVSKFDFAVKEPVK